MLWNNLHLRTRMLFGYGLSIILSAALVLFLLTRTSNLNAQIRELSAEVTREAATGTHLTAQVAATQQLVDRYLQQVDENMVDWLMRATSAARLMGARCILVGIGPEVAQALVASGANLANLTIRPDLRSAVEYAARGYGFTFAKG